MEMENQNRSHDAFFPRKALITEAAPALDLNPLNDFAKYIHTLNHSWWTDLETGKPLQRNIGELLMLCVSELTEALEGHRKNLMDDKLPHRKMFEVEIADTFIRLFDLCGGMNLDLSGAIRDKLEFNKTRADHQIENRKKVDGKKY